jgi:hypothetical protein
MPKTTAANEISFSAKSSEGFRPVDVGKTFGKDVDAAIEKWLYEALRNLIDAHADLHMSKIPKWRKIYDGKPESASKSFPFPNCANLVVQLVGDLVDTLTARILGFIFATSPLWRFMYPAATDSPDDSERKRVALEEFMDIVGYEPAELDLYRIYGQWCSDHLILGTAFIKHFIEDRIEAVAVGYTQSKARKFEERTIYEGPRVEKIAHEDVLMYADAQTVEKSRLVVHRRQLKKFDLEERVFTGFYDKDAVEKIIGRPDRGGPDLNKSKAMRDKGVQPIQSNVTAEWDVYECYFPWIHQGQKFRLIYSYHLSSKTSMRRIFNFIPDNATPIVRAKFGRTDGAYGKSMADQLEDYQKEVSLTHNNRLDNSTLANTRFFRIGPSAVNIGSQIDIFPSGAITANKDDFEAYSIADVYQSSFQNESVTMGLAQQRAGIAPAVTGSGTGGMQGKGQNAFYSAGPALAAMQESNHRTNLATSDFRHAHQKNGSMLTGLYAKFGIGDRGQMLGKNEKYLEQALSEFLKNRCRIPIRSSNSSLNKEVEKQNDMLMVGLIQRHYTAQAQLMQAINNPMIPPAVKEYLTRVMLGSDRIMKRVLKDFGYDQPDDFIPDASKTLPQGAPPNGPQTPNAASPNPAQLAASQAAGGSAGRSMGTIPFQPASSPGTPAL